MVLQFKPVDLPCEFDFSISRGTQSVAQHVFLSWEMTDGPHTWVGHGEAAPNAFYGETQASVLDFLAWVKDTNLLDGLTPFDHQRFHETFRQFPGHMPTKSALEMALYDLWGQCLGQPVYRLLGLDATRVLRSSYTIGLADLDMVRHKTQVALDRGYDILKVKVGGPQDLAILEAIRAMVPESTTIRVDANAAWLPDEAISLFPRLVDLDVEFVEEPLQRDVPMAERMRVKAHAPLPLIADESVQTLRDIPLVAGWVDGVNLKLTKTGGLTEALQMIHAARAHNLSVMLGCFVESSLAITAFAHLAPLADYLDLDGALLLASDPVTGIRWEGNRLFLPHAPGLGVQVQSNLINLR